MSDDPVLDSITAFRDRLDKRTYHGKAWAERVNAIVEAVEAERQDWNNEVTTLREQLVKEEAEKREHQQIVLKSGLTDEQQGYDHTFERPQVYEGSIDYGTWVKKDFTIAFVEEAMIRLRIAGGNDNTPIHLEHGVIKCDTRFPLPLTKAERRAEERAEWWYAFWRRALIIGSAVAAPAVAIALAAGVFNLYLYVLGLI